jgi:diguanylate cyclase (GGDEF)-like protein
MGARRKLCLVTLLLALPTGVPALERDKPFHDYVKDSWSIEQGLPQITVSAIAQDAQGYVWVGTQSGLARFDGVRFTTFTPDDTPALPGMLVQALLSDRDGTLWIGTYKGLARYRDRRFEAIPAPGGSDGSGLDVRALAQTADGRVAVGSGAGLFVVVDGRLEPWPQGPDAPVLALLADGDALWGGSEEGVWRLAPGAPHFEPVGAGEALSVNRLVRAGGKLHAATSRGLFVRGERAWERFAGVENTPVEVLHEDRDGNLWVFATDRLLRVQQGRVVETVSDDSPSAHRTLRAMHEDREGNLWLGSQWQGLARLWNGWTRRHGVDEGLGDPIVWSVARDLDDSVLVGGNEGLWRYRRDGFERVLAGSQLPHPNAYTLYPEAERVWIGTRRGVATLERDGSLRRPPELQVLDHAQINGFLRDRDGALWIATLSGLYRLADGALQHAPAGASAATMRARLLYQTTGGRLLVGTQDGLYERGADGFVRAGADAGLPGELDITAIHELPGGRLLVGALSEQLYLFADGRWFGFDRRQGLPANSPFFITHDSEGWVWVAGIRGVYRVPLAQLEAVAAGREPRVTQAQMLLSERGDVRGSQKGFCCNGAGNAKGFLWNDRLWLPTRGGVATLGSGEVRFNPLPPPVTIERVRHGGQWHTVQAGAPLVPPRGARDLAFEFTALSFQQPGSVELQYRLRGYDEDWVVLADPLRRDAVYTNLPAGNYVFEVQAANNAGVWNRSPAQLELQLPPFFHETPWFKLLVAALLLALGFAAHRWNTRQLRRRQLALEAQVADRTRALADANQRLEEMSHTDALTGLRNRRFLHGQLPADLSFYLREVRKPGNEGSVMMLALADIDHFKSINDRFGHAAGDLVLQQVARLLEKQVRSGDYVVRWGGEEFLLVFRPMRSEEAPRIAERVRRSVAEHPFDLGQERTLQVTTSIGFIEYPLFLVGPHTPDWQRMVELADRALYAVKASGRNGWATWRPRVAMGLDDVLAELDRAEAEGRAPADLEFVRGPARGEGAPGAA